MLSHRLQRVQNQLHSHRCWLSTFVQQSQRYHHIETPARNSLLHHQRARPFAHSNNGAKNKLPGSIAFASKKVERARRRREEVEITLNIKDQRERDALDDALNASDLDAFVEAYHGVENKRLLHRNYTSKIVSWLHTYLRKEKWRTDEATWFRKTAKIIEFAEELVNDIKNGTLQPSPRAHVRLLGIFKESGSGESGMAFWNWLEGQDENYVNSDVYGAAIELLAVQGTPLPELEELYQQALARFPGPFASYHLSPEAVLPDREKTTTLIGMPMVLFQGILTARLVNGDVRGAYLALDTALRLYPDQTPQRFFCLFTDERPIIEGYTVSAMARRAGVQLPQAHLKTQLFGIRSNPDAVSVRYHPMSLRGMLSIFYMHTGAGGSLTNNELSSLIVALTHFMRMDVVSDLPPKDKRKVVSKIMDVVRKSLAVFARFGARPGLAAFNAIVINLGGYGRSKQTIGVALNDAATLGLEPDGVTLRTVVVAAGMLEDADFVQKSWQQLLEWRGEAGETPDATDFHCLIKACHLTDQVDFARDEFENYRAELEGEEEMIERGLDDGNSYNLGVADSGQKVSVSSLLAEIDKISADLDVIDERTKDKAGSVQDFSEQKLPMNLLVDNDLDLPDADMRKIYDELTTAEGASTPSSEDTPPEDPNSVEPPPQKSLTPTNIPFSSIRYENWKLINWLLKQSESIDQTYRNAVDRAIEAGKTPPGPLKGLGPSLGWKEVRSVGLSDMVDDGKSKKKERPAKEEDVKRVREEILRLRGRL